MRFPLNCEVEKMSWKNAPPEVQAYFKNGARTPVHVRAVEPFVVSVTFDDGVTKEYDYTEKFTGILSEIKEPDIFSKVYLDDTHSICWDTSKGHMDFSSDTVYIYGKTVPAAQDNLKQ